MDYIEYRTFIELKQSKKEDRLTFEDINNLNEDTGICVFREFLLSAYTTYMQCENKKEEITNIFNKYIKINNIYYNLYKKTYNYFILQVNELKCLYNFLAPKIPKRRELFIKSTLNSIEIENYYSELFEEYQSKQKELNKSLILN